MAYIDKTYLKNYKDYADLHKWCDDQGAVTDDYGNKFRPLDFLRELTEDEWNEWMQELREHAEKNYNTPEYIAECKKLYGDDWTFNADNYCEIPIWNTPKYFDVWLIRNCPFDFIQDRLKEQYGAGWSKNALSNESGRTDYDAIKNYDSVWDHYHRGGIKNPHFSIKWKYNVPVKDDSLWWFITVEDKDGDSYWANDEDNAWYSDNELHPWSSNAMTKKGPFSLRKLARYIRKWNLPEGARVKVCIDWHRYICYEFVATIKR